VRQADGSFEPDSVNARVDQRLREMAETLQRFAKAEGKKNGGVDQANDAS
jgi:hypothetical protein